MYEWHQERNLIITSERVYNLKGKTTVKRAIPLDKIEGISKTTMAGKGKEFTFHVPSEYDYRFISDK